MYFYYRSENGKKVDLIWLDYNENELKCSMMKVQDPKLIARNYPKDCSEGFGSRISGIGAWFFYRM